MPATGAASRVACARGRHGRHATRRLPRVAGATPTRALGQGSLLSSNAAGVNSSEGRLPGSVGSSMNEILRNAHFEREMRKKQPIDSANASSVQFSSYPESTVKKSKIGTLADLAATFEPHTRVTASTCPNLT